MAKTIVLCCDGTGLAFQENRSNPLRLHYCLENGADQVSFYDPGVGTSDPNDSLGTGGPLSHLSEMLVGRALGHGILRNIADAYRYLMATYADGDRVFLFGFSRGAFTARALAGLLAKCGLLGADNDNLVPYALDIYLDTDNPGVARDFKASMSRPCPVRMIGTWDTVKGLGPLHYGDHFYTRIGEICEAAAHAVAIDEKRSDYTPELWGGGGPEDAAYREVWFPGVHSDVGGGYAADGLSNVTLRWMIALAEAAGVRFRGNRVREFEPDPTQAPHESYDAAWTIRGTTPRAVPAGARVHRSFAINREHHPRDGALPEDVVWVSEAESGP